MIREIRKKVFWVSSDWHYTDSRGFVESYIEWVEENCEGHYIIKEKWTHEVDETKELIGCFIYIENDEEAMAFKLRWL